MSTGHFSARRSWLIQSRNDINDAFLRFIPNFASEYISVGRTFAPFYRLPGDKRVMVYRRRYYYNGRSFISVVYFGRLRTSFCHCASRKIIYFANSLASIITATRKSRSQLAVLSTFTNMNDVSHQIICYTSRSTNTCRNLLASTFAFDWIIYVVLRFSEISIVDVKKKIYPCKSAELN